MKQLRKLGMITAALFALVLSAQGISAAEGAGDIDQHWNQKNILKWMNKSIISGYEDGSFRPDYAVTRAEFSAILDRVFQFAQADSATPAFTDITGSEWYAKAVMKMKEAGIINGYEDGSFHPNQSITRQEAAVILAKAFEVSSADTEAIAAYLDREDMDAWAAEAVAGLVQEGYMQGDGQHLYAKSNITRAELVMLIEQMAGDIWTGDSPSEITGNLMVHNPSVLKDVKIQGDVYLTPGILDGTVDLENVQVSGRLIVQGGGENSIHLKNTVVAKDIVVNDRLGKVRIVAAGESSAPKVILKSGAMLQNDSTNVNAFGSVGVLATKEGQQIKFSGAFSDVTLQQPGASISLVQGNIQSLVIDKNAESSHISVDSDASIGKLTANASAQVGGTGKITEAVIQAQNVVSHIAPEKLSVAASITATIQDKTVSETQGSSSTTTPATKPATKSGGGGGGSSSGGSGGSSGNSGSSGNNGNNSNSGNNGNNGNQTNPPIVDDKAFVESARISYVGPVKYLSIVFVEGTKENYAIAIDDVSVNDAVTPVTTEGRIVKYELQEGAKKLTVTKKATGKTTTFDLSS